MIISNIKNKKIVINSKTQIMKSVLLAFLFISVSAFTNAQIVNQIDNIDDMFTLKSGIDAMSSRLNDPDIKGSPFLHSDFQNIKIKGVAMKAKYNANLDYFEIDNKGEILFFGPTFEHRYDVVFTNLNTTYKAFEYEKLKLAFFKVLAKKGNAFLLSKQFIKYNPKVKAKDNFSSEKPARYERRKDVNYIKLSNQDIVIELPTRKSKFLKVFNSKSNEVKSFIKKEKLGIKKEEDLIKIFNYYTSL